jgi:mannose-6-phosphate isomerase-like protein (cupin superfamily)
MVNRDSVSRHRIGRFARLVIWVGVTGGLGAILACPKTPLAIAATAPPAPVGDLHQAAAANTAFRRVLMTGKHLQVVAMHLPAGVAIGLETHSDNDQMVAAVTGQVLTTVAGKTTRLRPHQAILIPAGAAHDVKAEGGKPAKILVFYTPPLHPANEVQQRKP